MKTPKDYNGELLYPMRKSDGTSLDYTQKTIGEKRRELLFMRKEGLETDPNATMDSPEATI